MDIATGMAVIAAALVGSKLISDKKGDVSPDSKPENVTTLGKNATALGYEQVPEGTDLQPGQMSVSTNENGEIVGNMVVTEGGTTVYQSTDGSVRTEGEIELNNDEIPSMMTAPAPQPGFAANPAQSAPMTNGAKSFPAPKRAITSALRDVRISKLRRQGFTFRL